MNKTCRDCIHWDRGYCELMNITQQGNEPVCNEEEEEEERQP